VVFDVLDELRDDAGPFFAEVDVVGLYLPDLAMAASRATACDPGSGPTQIDD
jgi:hypothetical protein